MQNDLKKIGLSENEAGVYMALLELGSSTAQQAAQKSGLKRPTAYVQLESLAKRGLISSFEKGKKTLFRAEDPEHLKQVLEKETEEAKEKSRTLEKILPGLGTLYLSAGERPRVRFFEGKEGLKTMQHEFLKTDDKKIEAISSTDDLLKIFPDHPSEFSQQRIKRGIKAKLIYTSAKGPFLEETDSKNLREARFVPPEKFPFSCDITIYGNNIALSALREQPIGIIIENKEIANSLRSVFSLAWSATKHM